MGEQTPGITATAETGPITAKVGASTEKLKTRHWRCFGSFGTATASDGTVDFCCGPLFGFVSRAVARKREEER